MFYNTVKPAYNETSGGFRLIQVLEVWIFGPEEIFRSRQLSVMNFKTVLPEYGEYTDETGASSLI